MIKVKTVHFVNYCGYTDTTFDFTSYNPYHLDGVKPFITLYGPNGIGKSTLLFAVRMASSVSNAFRGYERGSIRTQAFVRSMIHDEDYVPVVDNVKQAKKKDMLVDITYVTDEGDKKVIIDNDGLLLNELPKPPMGVSSWSYFADADNPVVTQKFLLSAEHARTFLSFAQEVYGYRVELGSPVVTQGMQCYTDCIIHKGPVKVHYKRMSAGEKKIATLVSDLCQPVNTGGRDIILIDNVEMHVYYKRHTRMIDKLISCFPDKQIITTSHSGVVIDHISPEARYDLEEYRPDYRLYESTEEMPIIDPPPFQEMKSLLQLLQEMVPADDGTGKEGQ